MGDELLKELTSLKKKITLMPNSIKRDYLLLDYAHLYCYLEQLNIDLDDELLDFDHIKRVNKITNDGLRMQINEYILDNKILENNIKEILDLYHQNNFYAINNFDDRINYESFGVILKDFFKSIGDDIYEIYQRLVTDTFIGYSPSNDSNGQTFHRMFDNISNVIMNNNGDHLTDYATFVHEVGHVYQFYLQRNSKYLLDIHYGTEITSRLLEKLFKKYLLDNHLFSNKIDKLISLYHYQNINLYAHCSLICDIISSKNYRLEDNLVFTNLSDNEIKSYLEKKCGYVYSYLTELDYVNILYIIGDIISSNFYLKIVNDKDEGLKKLKDYLVSLDSYNLEESLNLYGNMNYAKLYIQNDLDYLNNKVIRKVK